MRKAAIILIGLGILVVVAGQTYLSWQTEPERPVVANKATLRNTESGTVVGFIDKLGAQLARHPIRRTTRGTAALAPHSPQ